jgi:putative DNA primase/helicase
MHHRSQAVFRVNKKVNAYPRDILERLSSVRRNTTGWTARCPAHNDRRPSLSITERQGKILLHCFAGCTAEAICGALGIHLRDLFTEPEPPAKPLPSVVRDVQQHIRDLRSRLTPRDRKRPITVVYANRQNPDPAMARALALSVEGELCQLLFKDQR